jgi:CRP-like cAMP-binding protein
MHTISQKKLASMRDAGFFATFDLTGRDGALRGLSVVSLQAGRMLFNEGEPAAAFYFVVKGWAALFREHETGQRAAIHLLGPNESFGEALLQEGSRYPVSAEAATDLELVRVDCRGFRQQVLSQPPLALAIVEATLAKNKRLIDRILQDQTWSPPRRIAAFLCRFCAKSSGSCEFELPVEQRFIAARLSMSPSTFSRSLGELELIGISARRGRITVRDAAWLHSFVSGASSPDDH